ncbi:Odorant receptor 10 [Cephus cinctus]|uniref:Odorant receptor n=1 Tax=Cephus cinctus TaxID=211228 RepID=A0A1W6L1H0_CEPCN|nr:odorant receptor 13a isoform X2 [Cephus cinctus]ARN17914.1 odorant receptor 43 [Cephus cinctus]RLZ02187.1 Odorant receptor 10 [Cephus cinctus]
MKDTAIVGKPVEIGLRLIDSWPGASNRIGRLTVWSLMMAALIFQYWDAVSVFNDLDNLMDNFSVTITETLFFVKLIIVYKNRRYVNEVLKHMSEDWNSVKSVEEWTVMTEHAKLSRIFYIWALGLYVGTVVLFLPVVINHYNAADINDRKFVLPSEYPFQSKVSPVYEVLCCVQFLQAVLTAAGNALTESLLVTLVLHAGSRLVLLRKDISRFSDISRTVDDRRKILLAGNVLVANHRRVIEFSDKIEDLFSYISLVQVLSSTLIICTIGFMFITSISSTKNILTLMKFGLFILGELWETLAYCLAGEYLSNQSQSISQAVYECPWYKMQPRDSKMLMMIMIRAQKPLRITAGKFIFLSLDNFTDILKTSLSYISVLRAIY